MILYTSSASLVFADAIGASMTILSIHTKPATLPLREQYPRRIDTEGNFVITPGVEGYYERQLPFRPWKMDAMRVALGVGYDCADLKAGYVHWGGRWVFPWKKHLQLNIGLGPSLFFRESAVFL